MPTFGNSNLVNNVVSNLNAATNMDMSASGWGIVTLFMMIVIGIVLTYMYWPQEAGNGMCPKEIHMLADGTFRLKPTGQVFPDMNAFQQWWHKTGLNERCKIPLLTGGREIPVMGQDTGSEDEQTYAKTPIYKVDDYEFSRIFGVEKGGRMVEDRENYNEILMNRSLDWADRPMSSDERRQAYAGLREGFTASGDMTSEIVNRFGEKKGSIVPTSDPLSEAKTLLPFPSEKSDPDIDCKISRETKEVARMVEHVYEKEPDYEPVITKVGPNHWEVNELKPRRRTEPWFEDTVANNQVVNTLDPKVDLQFRYREKEITDVALDPYFGTEDLPFTSEKADPFYGPVPGMERMMGPTLDRKEWY